MPDTAVQPADHLVGAFSASPPWTVDPESMPWRAEVDELREQVARKVPRWTRRRLLPGTRAAHVLATFQRYLVPWFFIDRRRPAPASKLSLARALRRSMEHLGPTYIKVGQFIAAAEGMMPAEAMREFRSCQDSVPAEPFRVVRATIEGDLGRSLEEVFTEFDEVPMASASIAQVYAATLRGGERVAVKVQRRGIESTIKADVRVMAWAARRLARSRFKTMNPLAFVELFTDTVVEELDFRIEAQNMLDIAAVLAATEQRQVVIPRPHPELVTQRVLVMERLDGVKVDDLEGLRSSDIAAAGVFRALFTSFFEGAVIHGVFHGDLHAGNAVSLPDGKCVLYDCGITGRFSESARTAVLRLLLSFMTGDRGSQLTALRDLGAFPPDVDFEKLQEEYGDKPVFDVHLDDASSEDDEGATGAAVQVGFKELLAHGARLPKDLMVFFKGFVYLTGALNKAVGDLTLGSMREEIQYLFDYFTQTHGDQLSDLLGFDPRAVPFDAADMTSKMAGGADVHDDMTLRELSAAAQAKAAANAATAQAPSGGAEREAE